MSDGALLCITAMCLVGIFNWVLEWAKALPVDQEFEDTEYPNEEDE